jgi:hypothetical protein
MIEIQDQLKKAIEILFEKDNWLLTQDLSEQSISHKLAEYLQDCFPDYNVDCEYNGNIDSDNARKSINVLKEELSQIGLLRDKERDDLEKEFTTRAVFPDIIIHRRKTNEHNICIVEVKKSTSAVPFDYDQIKLKYYTSNNLENALKYKLGVFIIFNTGSKELGYEMIFYQNGTTIK